MIVKLSKLITGILLNQKSISEKDIDIYQYGIEITISSLLNIALIVIVSLITNSLFSGLIFLSTFILLRQFTGGYHAESYFKCNTVLVSTYILVLLLSRLIYLEFRAGCIILLLGVLVVIFFTPVYNAHKELSRSEYRKSKKISIILYLLFSVASIITFQFNQYYGRVFIFTLGSILMLIIIEIFLQRRGFHESKKDCR